MTQNTDNIIASIAVCIDNPQQFKARAAEVAKEYNASIIAELSTRFHSPLSPEPDEFTVEKRGLGGWLSAWQFAIFELLFEYGEAALPLLRETAFGEYDWTQGNALEVLVRLAARGVESETIIAEIRQVFPELRDTAQYYMVSPLLRHAKQDAAVASIIERFEDMPEWQECIDDLNA